MKRLMRVGFIALAVSLALLAVAFLTAGLSGVRAITAEVDLIAEAKAPDRIAAGSEFVINASYANKGNAPSSGNQMTASLPMGAEFITSTNEWGEPFPPSEIDGNSLTWEIRDLLADSTWGHIFIVMHADDSLSEGDLLTTTVSIFTTEAVEPNTDNNTASVTSIVSEMAGSAKQAHNRYIIPADVLTYTIRINPSNQFGGGENGRWVTLTDTLPFSHQVRFLGWTGTVTGAQIDGQMLKWEGKVFAGEPISFQYRLGVEGTVTPGALITNVAMMRWAGHQMQLGPVTTVVTSPYGSLALGPYQAGELRHDYGVTLSVPADAVTDTTRFELEPLPPDAPAIDPPGGLLFANRAFELNAFRFGESVRQFNRPLTIIVGFADTDVAGLRRETLRLWTREGPTGPWAQLDEPTQVMPNALAFTTDHLSQFALFGEALVAEVDLIAEAKAPDRIAAGSEFVINASYANKGNAPSSGNQMTASLPMGAEFITSTNEWGEPFPPSEIDGNSLTWEIRDLLADSTWGHIFIVMHADDSLSEGDLLTTTVSIFTTEAVEPNTDNNTASVTSIVSEMAGSAKQAHNRYIIPADVLTYTIRINPSNQFGGGENGRWVTLTDTLPFSHQVRFLGWTGTVTGVQIDGQMLKWEGKVFAGEPISFQYRLGVEGTVTPGALITNVAMMRWAGHQMQLGPVTTVVTLPYGSLALGPYQAGELRHDYGVTLSVPTDAVTDTTRFELEPLPPDAPAIDPPGGLLFANRAFELNAFRFGESVRQFNRPLTIVVGFADTDVAGLRRETLRLWTREGPSGPWAQLDEPTQVMPNALAFTTDHLSQFALFGEGRYQVYLPLTSR